MTFIPKNNSKKGLGRRIWEQKPFLLMMLPGFLYYIVYKYAPIIMGVMTSVMDYNIRKGLFASKLLNPWYKNYQFFFHSPYFSQLLSNTLLISLAKMVIGMPLAVLLAVFLFECKNLKVRRAVQTITYMPNFLSWVVIYGMCFGLLSESNGLVNSIIRSVTGSSVPFFTSPRIFRGLVIGSDIWKTTGWSAIIYMAAISGIDPCLYEAACIDGAGRVRSIIHVTIPCIMPVVVISLILRCGSILDAGFDQIFVMYNPAVRSTVDIIDTWVYRTGLEQLNISLSSAVGLFKSFVSMLLVVFVNALARRWGGAIW